MSGTRKISIRLDASLYAELEKLATISPSRSMTAVVDDILKSSLLPSSTTKARAYLGSAVANLAVMLELLGRDQRVQPKDIMLISDIYGMLLEMLINVDGVEE
jgi:hypothetical protein